MAVKGNPARRKAAPALRQATKARTCTTRERQIASLRTHDHLHANRLSTTGYCQRLSLLEDADTTEPQSKQPQHIPRTAHEATSAGSASCDHGGLYNTATESKAFSFSNPEYSRPLTTKCDARESDEPIYRSFFHNDWYKEDQRQSLPLPTLESSGEESEDQGVYKSFFANDWNQEDEKQYSQPLPVEPRDDAGDEDEVVYKSFFANDWNGEEKEQTRSSFQLHSSTHRMSSDVLGGRPQAISSRRQQCDVGFPREQKQTQNHTMQRQAPRTSQARQVPTEIQICQDTRLYNRLQSGESTKQNQTRKLPTTLSDHRAAHSTTRNLQHQNTHSSSSIHNERYGRNRYSKLYPVDSEERSGSATTSYERKSPNQSAYPTSSKRTWGDYDDNGDEAIYSGREFPRSKRPRDGLHPQEYNTLASMLQVMHDENNKVSNFLGKEQTWFTQGGRQLGGSERDTEYSTLADEDT